MSEPELGRIENDSGERETGAEGVFVRKPGSLAAMKVTSLKKSSIVSASYYTVLCVESILMPIKALG